MLLNDFKGSGFYNSIVSIPLKSIGTAFLLPYLSTLKTGRGFIFKLLSYISLISYSMYLVNRSLVREWILKSINISEYISNPYLAIIFNYFLFFIFTILISMLLYKYFESPIMKLRDKK